MNDSVLDPRKKILKDINENMRKKFDYRYILNNSIVSRLNFLTVVL